MTVRARAFLVLWALLSAGRLHSATFASARQDLLGARSAGLGGAEVAADPSLEALAHNPAALIQEGSWHLAMFGAGGSDPQFQAAAGVIGILDPETRLGFFFNEHSDSRLLELHEQTIAGVASFQLLPDSNMGLRLNAQRLVAGSLGDPVWGGTLDAGIQVGGLRALGLPGYFALGAAADNLASVWQDDTWTGSVPAALRAGLGWRPWARFWLGGELDWATTQQLPTASTQSWNAGAEYVVLGAWALRGGWRAEADGQWTAGLGGPLGSVGARLDYAFLSATKFDAMAHRLSVAWSFENASSRKMGVEAVQGIFDPDTGVVRQARFVARLDPSLNATQWKLELKDETGKLVRTLGPLKVGETFVDWDGHDDQGQAVPGGDKVVATLVVSTDQGELRQVSSKALASALVRAEQKTALSAANKGGLSAPILKPVFSAGDSSTLDYVVMEMPSAKKLDTKAWRLEIKDSKERKLRSFAGQGYVPAELVWDGLDDKGVKVQDALGVQIRLEVDDQKGRTLVQAQPLFTQKAFEIAKQEARKRPELRLAALGLPLSMGRHPLTTMTSFLPELLASAERSQQAFAMQLKRQELEALQKLYGRRGAKNSWDLDLFDERLSDLKADRAELLRPMQQHAFDAPGSDLLIVGLTKEGEKDALALGQHRAVAASRHFRKQGSLGTQLTLAEPPAAADFKGVRIQDQTLTAASPVGDQKYLRAQTLAAASVDRLSARYAPGDLEASQALDSQVDYPFDAAGTKRVLGKWGLDSGAPMALTQWCPATSKLAIYKDGWIWVTDAQGSVLRSLWYEPDLNAAGQLRWSKDGKFLWIHADGWRRWFSLEVSVR